MSTLQHGESSAAEADGNSRARRRPGWGNTDVLRVAALVIGMYLLIRLLWFAHLLMFVAFLGILFGLAIASGVDRLERFRIPRGIGASAIVIAFFGLLVGFGAWLAPTIHDQSIELRRRLPDAIERLETWMNRRETGIFGMAIKSLATGAQQLDTGAVARAPGAPPSSAPSDSITIRSTLRQRVSSGMGGITQYLFPFVTSTISVIAGFLIIVFLAIYIAVEPGMYKRGIMHLFPHDHRRRAGEVLTAIAMVLRKWLVTQLIAMLTIWVISTVTLLLLGVKAAIALGLLAGLFEFIPTVGPIMSALPAIAMGFLDSPEKALTVTVVYVLIQFFENHVLIPLLMKGGMNLAPALTVFTQALMAMCFGFLGLMCAVPILAAVTVGVRMLYVEGVVGDDPDQEASIPPPAPQPAG